MIIRNKPCIVYDIEVFINVFHCTLYNTETQELIKFECSQRKNEIHEMCQYFLNTDAYFVGYNNIHYDNPIINYCIEFFNNDNYTHNRICESIFNMSNIITSNDDNNFDKWKRWKYAKNFFTLDLLTMLYSKQLRVSLKEMQVTMMYKNVQEFNIDWRQPLLLSQIDEMIQYNINDVMSTTELLNRCKKDIELRINIEDQYHIDCLSKDGVGIGAELLKQEYLQATGLKWDDIKDLRSPMDRIPLKDVILPNISFKTPLLNDLLTEMKGLVIGAGREAWNKKFIYANNEVSIGVGGIHTINKPEIIIPEDDEVLLDSDVSSLYPSLIVSYGFVPPHLKKEIFLKMYDDKRISRLKDKAEGRKLESETKKLLLNSTTGNYQNEFSWLYSPFAVMQIRINGQLILLMFTERLLELGAKIKQLNTDGILYIIKKDKREALDKMIAEFQKEVKLTFETDEFKSFYQLAVNDYFAITPKDEVKEKGCFITSVKLGKGLTPKIIPKAVIAYFKDGIPIEDTIKNCTDIKDFLMSEKTGKQWHVEYLGKEQQRINRFYASTNGGYLWKWKYTGYKEGEIVKINSSHDGYFEYTAKEKQYQNMLTASGVTLLNKFDDKPINERKINYRYYITEAAKLINQLKVKQLSLW